MVWTALTRVFWIEKYAPVSDCLLLDFGGSYLPAMLLLICCSLFGLVSFLLFTWHDMIWWFTMGSDKRIDSCIRWTTQSLSSTGVFFSPNPRERGWWALFQNMTPYIKTSHELRMLSRSLSDCKSLLLNVMIQVSQFIRNGQLCH